MKADRAKRWIEALRSQEVGYTFSEGLAVGQRVRAPADRGGLGLPILEVLASEALDVKALRVHSLHVRASMELDAADDEGLSIHVLRLLAILVDGEEVEVLREAIPIRAEGEEAPEIPSCAACNGLIFDYAAEGRAIAIDGMLYHRGCIIGED